jgi:hypothetical protein
MYLEPIRAVGLPRPIYQIRCPADSIKAGNLVYSDFQNNPYPACGGRKSLIAPPTKETALFSYDLLGTTSWTYGECKSGFTKKLSGKPHPYYYTCFKK